MCAKRKVLQKESLLFSDEFYSDIFEEGMYFASIVRSPVSKGRIIKILTEELPEGYSFFSWEDLPLKKNITFAGPTLAVFCAPALASPGWAAAS